MFVCISCSGIHRNLGTHISQVRSVTLDTWTPAQVTHFQKLGNAKAAQYFEACIPPDFRRPAPGDAIQMERFIREKYETKRFITVENGGLGGSAPTRGSRRHSYQPNGSASRSASQATMGLRPMQGTDGYDDNSSRGRSSLPISYGDRFRPGAPPWNGGIPYGSESQGRYNSGRGLGSLARPKNAIQRANTLKEIMNMGFPAQLAARAVEAGEGDLQRAVDWVLENSNSQSTVLPQPAKPIREGVQRDLLDFGDPEPAPISHQQSPPNIVSTQSLVGPAAAKPSPFKTPENDFADFGDFGAFESALPAKTYNSSTTSNPPSIMNANAGNGSLSGAIASLYAQGPTKGPTQTSQGSSQLTKIEPVSHRSNQFLSRSPKMLSPQITSRPFPKSPSGKATPETIPSFSWPTVNKPTSPIRGSPTLNSKLSRAAVHNVSGKESPSILSPPPPPPMADLSIRNTQDVPPPPPNCPPPAKESLFVPPRTDAKTAPQPVTNVPPSEGGHGTTESVENEAKKEAETEEDPFAALSMFALSSATAKKKSVENKPVSKPDEVEKKADPKEPSTMMNNGSAGINVDDFFG